jgi:hypothetical protein
VLLLFILPDLTFNVCLIKFYIILTWGARGSVVGWGTMRDRVPITWISSICLILPAGSTQFLTKMSTRNFPGGKSAAGAYGWQTHRHLWNGCLHKMWEPRRLTTLWVSTTCYRYIFTFLPFTFYYYISSIIKGEILWYVCYWNSGEPHCSDFKTVVLSFLCAMYQYSCIFFVCVCVCTWSV